MCGSAGRLTIRGSALHGQKEGDLEETQLTPPLIEQPDGTQQGGLPGLIKVRDSLLLLAS